MTDDLSENYRSAYFGTLGFGKAPALILVDLVEAYFNEDSPLYARVDDALASALRICDAARSAGIPIFYTNVVYQKGGEDGGVFFRKVPILEVFEIGSPLGAWASGIEPAEGEALQARYDEFRNAMELIRDGFLARMASS